MAIGRRNHQRLFVAQAEGQQAEGRDFGGRIHPDFFFVAFP